MKALYGLFSVFFCLSGIVGLLGMMIWAIGGPTAPVHWSVFGTLGFILTLIAGILLSVAEGKIQR